MYGLIMQKSEHITEKYRGIHATVPRIFKWYFMIACFVVLVIIFLTNCNTRSVGIMVYQSDLHIWRRQLHVRSVQQRTEEPHPTKPTTGWRKTGILYELPEYNISILSAIGRNRSTSREWEEIVLNGWEGRRSFYKKVYCCFHYISGGSPQLVPSDKTPWLKCNRMVYTATQFTCPNPGKRNGSYPVAASMSSSSNYCNSRSIDAIPIHYPQRQSQSSIGVCAKIAYGSISPKLLVEWYEIQKQLGVNKVVTFIYNVTDSARMVLLHYQHQGFVELLPYQFPNKECPKRNVGDKTGQVFNDEQVVVFDCAERLAGYAYVGILDHDEFIIPSQASVHTWKHLFKMFLDRKPTASGFVFRTEIFVTDWGKVDNSSSFLVAQYRNRTRPMLDREKAVYMPKRVAPGYYVPAGLATLKHYRPCRQEWLDNKNCFSRPRFKDEQMIRVVGRLNKTAMPFQHLRNQI